MDIITNIFKYIKLESARGFNRWSNISVVYYILSRKFLKCSSSIIGSFAGKSSSLHEDCIGVVSSAQDLFKKLILFFRCSRHYEHHALVPCENSKGAMGQGVQTP